MKNQHKFLLDKSVKKLLLIRKTYKFKQTGPNVFDCIGKTHVFIYSADNENKPELVVADQHSGVCL
ncbi:hypothetical protein HNR65_001203 [Desulfosalsimonas propionicica]|uniref:Uncharacterized protein n=1 Tax=Desulfosalsimonas propionicica TaxID=332175 RepID=A0A7W0C876_9BACT|nr:hypothetical protein [Desulfosalsimonas propionicica]